MFYDVLFLTNVIKVKPFQQFNPIPDLAPIM